MPLVGMAITGGITIFGRTISAFGSNSHRRHQTQHNGAGEEAKGRYHLYRKKEPASTCEIVPGGISSSGGI